MVGIFVLWEQNQTLKRDCKIIKQELEKTKASNANLQKIILTKNQQLKQKIASQATKINHLELENKTVVKNQKQETQVKKVLLIIPNEDKKFSKIIPKIDFKDIDLKSDETTKAKNSKDDIKVNPEVYIDKDTKKLDGAKITIETKF
ncbi:MAG: hypothetical protein ACO29X_00800 [Arcobacteraceae bacterium]